MTDKDKHKNHETGRLWAEKRSSSSSGTAGVITGDTNRRKHDPAIQQVELEMQILELQNALIEVHNTRQRLEKRMWKKTVDLRQINEQLRCSQNELIIFAKKTVEKLERERQKVSDALHDTVAQGLAAIKLFLENKLALMGKEEIPSSFSIESILGITQDNLNEIRRIINYLRPKMLDDIGLLATIQWHWRELQDRRPDIALKIKLAATETDIPVKQKLIIYRIIREAFENIERHWRATHVEFELTHEDQTLKLEICDMGRGFDIEGFQAGLNRNPGLISIKEYTELSEGQFSLRSSQNKGTCIESTWDLGNQ